MKLTKFQRTLMIILAVLLIFNLLLANNKLKSLSDKANNNSYSFLSMMRYSLIQNPINSLFFVGNFIEEYYQIYQENVSLKSQIDNLTVVQELLNENQRQIEELKEINSLSNITNQYTIVNATVIERNYEDYSNHFIINVGSNDGIYENYAVMTTKGLIGKVESCTDSTSVVKLLTTEDQNNKVSVNIILDDSRMSDAILDYYDYDKKAYRLKLLDTNTSITVGSKVVTSGMGGIFPSGILVGEVVDAQQVKNQVSMNVYVEPASDFSGIKYVQVLIRGDIDD